MMKIAICPNCDTELEEDEYIDNNFEKGFIGNCIAGHCPICEKKFQWLEVDESDNMEVIKEVP